MNRDLVRLRPVGEADVDDILGWVNDREIVGNLASFSGTPFSREDEVAYVRAMMASNVDRVFSVLAADDGRYVGQIGIHQIFWRSRVGRLSLVIGSKDEWGKGFGSAAIARILDLAFGHEELHKIWLMVFRTNERSRRTYERAGFTVEGTLREEYFHDGAWHDMVRMSMLSHEWS
ncbi:MAG TPA: GNAT family protein [Kofleriaceae bacterium]|nr:GNAT family protein [Kofleriaceae bacterium]